jgi:hypothetical protein
MATIFLPGFTARVLFKVMMKQADKWQTFTNYHGYADAELCACGLITGGKASECHVVKIDKDGSRIVAVVSSEPANGWPHGRAVVKKV